MGVWPWPHIWRIEIARRAMVSSPYFPSREDRNTESFVIPIKAACTPARVTLLIQGQARQVQAGLGSFGWVGLGGRAQLRQSCCELKCGALCGADTAD